MARLGPGEADSDRDGQQSPPLSTYRLQLSPERGLDEAAGLVGYLARLGVTHLYLSPVLQSAPGSQHGYDVVDHGRVSDDSFVFLANPRAEAATFVLPPAPFGERWVVVLDTAQDSAVEEGEQVKAGADLVLESRSLVLLRRVEP